MMFFSALFYYLEGGKMQINVTSEIKPLKRVLLHKPGKELLNLTPNSLNRLLFDDIPFLEDAIKEHDQFANILRDNGVEVVYLEDLMTEVLETNPEIKERFIVQFINEANLKTKKYKNLVKKYLMDITDTKSLVLKTMEGIQIDELSIEELEKEKSLVDLVKENGDFLTDPMPNLYFTRDNFASIGHGISLNRMYSITRCRETIYAEYIFNYHKDYNGTVRKYYDRYKYYSIEGGDILILNENVIAVGLSQRTTAEAIDDLARSIFSDSTSKIKTILAFAIPNTRAFMHLDTVFTQIDYDKFTYHPGIMDTLKVFEITEGDDPTTFEDLNVVELNDSLENILEKYLCRNITLIPCAGGDAVGAQREQWNDGSNTLCIRPGVVVCYNRNNITNDILRKNGIKVLEMNSAELSRGRGGPRCMSMPLIRED